MEGGARRTRHRGRLPYATHAADGVVVNAYSEGWLRQGFPWVYHDEVVGRTGSLLPGRVVAIHARDGTSMGTGIWDEGRIEVRRFRPDPGPIDAGLLRERVLAAKARRPDLSGTTAWRWIHGENDDLPGVRVEVWDRQLAILLDSPSLAGLCEPLVEVLADVYEPDAIWLGWRPSTEDDPGRFEGLRQGLVWGQAPEEEIVVEERGIKARVRPWAGLDAGLFADMRDIRGWLTPHWAGRRVLNLFAYTGMFTSAAALGGAWQVVSVDLSAGHLARARDNLALNHIDPEAHEFIADDCFHAMDQLRRKGEEFDLIVADPPSFSHGPEGPWSVATQLPRLVAAALRLLRPGGWLVVACNHGAMSPKDFQRAIQKGSAKAKRPVRLLHEGSTPIDFPAALDFPESRYLKCWVLAA